MSAPPVVPARAGHRTAGLTARLLGAHLLVGAVAALTISVVVLTLGPPLFAAHLRRAHATAAPGVNLHAQEALRTATGIALTVGAGAGLLVAIAISILITRRLTRPVYALRAAADRLAAGDPAARMPSTRLGSPLDALADAFNALAGSLQQTENTRRRLLGDLAHELRTPLATLDAYLEALADGVREPTTETWRILAGQAARLRRLADDLALVSRAEEHALPLHKTPVSAADVVTAAVGAARPAYRTKGVHLTTQTGSTLPTLTADPDRLHQVLANLLANALRHTPPGGRVAVSACAAGTGVQITVTDTGEGISAGHLPHIFERFYRADPARSRADGGSGIGLTIARALIRDHGGTLSAESAGPGAGSRFTITLPV